MNCNVARKRSVLRNPKELAKISRSTILWFLSYLIWVELEKKTMNIPQWSHFDRSCRSVHVTRACKQAPLAQLSWWWAERNFPGYSNQIFQVAETTLCQWAQRILLCKDSFNRGRWLLYSEMKILSTWTMYHLPSATILAVGTKFLSTTNEYFSTSSWLNQIGSISISVRKAFLDTWVTGAYRENYTHSCVSDIQTYMEKYLCKIYVKIYEITFR